MSKADIDTMRRRIAAMNFLISGPTLVDALDPSYVLTGAGTGFTEKEKQEFSAKLIRFGRSMVFQEYSMKGGKLAYDRLHIVETHSKGASWWSDCTCWTPGPQSEVILLPLAEGSTGHLVNRGGALSYVPSRPPVTDEGILLAAKRMAGIVQRLSKGDYAGQVRENIPGGGLRYWQREGFRVRLDS